MNPFQNQVSDALAGAEAIIIKTNDNDDTSGSASAAEGTHATAFYERNTLEKLIASASALDPRYQAMVLLGCDAGPRFREMTVIALVIRSEGRV